MLLMLELYDFLKYIFILNLSRALVRIKNCNKINTKYKKILSLSLY